MSNIKKKKLNNKCRPSIIASHQVNKSINQSIRDLSNTKKEEGVPQKSRKFGEGEATRWGPTNGSMIWGFIAVKFYGKKSS